MKDIYHDVFMLFSSLGGLFDIKSFHRACIQCGQVPLQLLEQSIQDFINHTKREGTDI